MHALSKLITSQQHVSFDYHNLLFWIYEAFETFEGIFIFSQFGKELKEQYWYTLITMTSFNMIIRNEFRDYN